MKETLIGVLKSSHTQKIRFTYLAANGGAYRVLPNDFTTVALNLEQGNLGVHEGGAPPGTARYSIRKDGS